jgi:hypothetical protein
MKFLTCLDRKTATKNWEIPLFPDMHAPEPLSEIPDMPMSILRKLWELENFTSNFTG